jgi:acetyltransferase-like isoleucine patch superfamily enzyme
MKNNDILDILFRSSDYTTQELYTKAAKLSFKELRWLAENHYDNRTRKLFFKLTNVSIGKDSVINKNLIVSDDYEPLLYIGNRVAISPNVTVICSSGPNNSNLTSNSYVKDNLIVKKNVIISDDVWIGANVLILPGVKIGNGTVVGAGSVVVENLNSNSIYAGNPTKLIRTL